MLLTSPRSDPLRSTYLSNLASARLGRFLISSDENGDLDKSIAYSAEAILLPFRPPIKRGSNVITTFFFLADALLRQSHELEQPGNVEYCVKYLRYLRDQLLGTPQVTCADITACLVRALAAQVELESVDPMQGISEMAALCCELLTSGVPECLFLGALKAFVQAIRVIPLVSIQTLPDQGIRCLREAIKRLPEMDEVSLELVYSLVYRFNQTYSHDDYEEAMSIMDRILADPNRHAELVELATAMAGSLAFNRFQYYGKPEHIEEAILRISTLLGSMSFEDPQRRTYAQCLERLEKARLDEFNVAINLREAGGAGNNDAVGLSRPAVSPQVAKSDAVKFPLVMPDERNKSTHLERLDSMQHLTDLADIEKGIEYCRFCLTSPHPFAPITSQSLGLLLYLAFRCTGNVDYLNQSIDVQRDTLKMPLSTRRVVVPLISSLFGRFLLSEDRKDYDEIMELFPIIVTDARVKVPDRFWASCQWTWAARGHGHPSTPTAYENALSLMQECLTFAPTLEIQHFRLVTIRDEYEKLPLDYASYQIHIGQLEQAVETLERGRGLLWSEMRGFRALIDHLGVVNLPLAEKFAAVNLELEELTMTRSADVWMDDGQADNGGEGMDAFGRLVMKQQKLVQERDKLISQIQSLPGFETFSKAHSFDTLRFAAAHGPVVIINHSQWRSDIIILYHDSPPSLIPTSRDFYGRAEDLKDELQAARDKGLDSAEYEETLSCVLENLYDLVGRPVIQRLNELKVPEQSRLWWCPTSVFCSLPLHAMGPIKSDGGRNKLYFSDLYIPSYTPTLSALIESRNPGGQAQQVQPSRGKPSMLLVAHPDARMPSALQEMQIVQAVCPSVDTLLWKTATPIATLQHIREHRFAHISCHGILEIGRPFEGYLKLHKGARLTLLDIVRSQVPTPAATAEFAFLSACHTAEITQESIADEGLHLAAAVQYSGFRSVVGTMWEMADDDGPDLAETFYRSVFSVSDGRWGRGVPYHERTAEALRDAVVALRTSKRKRDMTLERWVNFVHFGA